MHIFRYINQTLIGFLEILALMNNASTLLGKGGGGGGGGEDSPMNVIGTLVR